MLNESSRLCSELLEFIKGEAYQLSGAMQSEVIKHGLDGYFVVESEMKVQGLKHGIENLTKSLQQIFVLLHDKSTPAASISQWKSMDANGIMQSKRPTLEDVMKYELKEETVQTYLLRQKLYSKEQEVEQLQAELSTVWKYAEMNVLLNPEVAELKDKVHDLDLEVLLMDRQITNLKDALVKQSKRLLMEQGKRRCWGVSFPQKTPINGMIQ